MAANYRRKREKNSLGKKERNKPEYVKA